MEQTPDEMVIHEPLRDYKNIYKDKHHENVVEFLNTLIEKSQVDIASNQATVKKIREKESLRNQIVKKINGQNTLKIFLVLLIVSGFLAAIYGGYQIYSLGPDLLSLILLPLGIILPIVFIILIIKTINPKLKTLKIEKYNMDEKIKVLYDEAYAQMLPLNSLFYEGMASELFQKTIPLIQLDKMFDSKRLDYMVNKFGLDDTPDLNRSTLYVKSGEIKGNPFYIAEDLVHQMGQKNYSGSITIHWTTTSRVNGRTVVNRHTQVLTATVTKPYPMYAEQSYLVYANDAAPDLIFSRTDSDAENLNEKQIDRHVNRQIKQLEKKSQKAITTGSNYTVIGNSEFEVLWGATNRNNEVQFRLLFTPLAQKHLLELMKEKEIGFGDDFDFIKHKKINIVLPEHLAEIKLNVEPSYFHSYDIELIKEKFINYNNSYLKHVYFAFGPILAIPLYQQTVTQEYIYKDLYPSYVSFFEHESIVNRMNENDFKHPESVTRNILKTRVIQSKDQKDQLHVVSFGYKRVPRVDYVTKFGGDGKMHTIPVHWDEYISVDRASNVEINVLTNNEKENHQDKIRNMIEGFKNKEIDQKDLFILTNFIARVTNNKINDKIKGNGGKDNGK